MDEQKKYEVIKNLVDHPETANKNRAALSLGCTRRHINRMIRGYQTSGKEYFVHGNRGRQPATTISDDLKKQIVSLYQNKYQDANFKHFTELLGSREDIRVSVSSVANILESEYILSPMVTKAKKKRFKKRLEAQKESAKTQKKQDAIQANLVAVEDAHSRRPRCAYFGELEQLDATPYEWIPDQVWHLHLAIDDATSTVTGAWFDTQETLAGYYHVFQQILTDYGIPYKFLTDRRTVFTYKKKGASSDEEDTYTQFAYACKQFGVDLESSSVPQAKGRVERLNWTLQSRLPVELRLAGVTDINSANEFLHSYIKEFNLKFALPIDSTKSVFEEQPSQEKINLTLAVLTQRKVDSGHAIQFRKHFYRMLNQDGQQVHFRKGTTVMVIQAFDGNLYTCVNDKDIYVLEEIPARQSKSKNFDSDYTDPKPRKKYIPPMNHPWRQSTFSKFTHSQKHRIEQDIQDA